MRVRFANVSRWLSVIPVVVMLCLPGQSFGTLTVTSKDIVPADGTTGQDVSTGVGIKTGHIQDGAVTNSKISGTIDVDKLATYSGMKIVHTGPVDHVNTFNSINEAIISAGGNVIKIMPGQYNEDINVTANIYIEGVDQQKTVINGKIDNNYGYHSINLKNVTINSINSMYDSVTLDNVVTNGNVQVWQGGLTIKNSIVNGYLSTMVRAFIKGVKVINGEIGLYGSAYLGSAIIDTEIIPLSDSFQAIMISNSANIGIVPAEYTLLKNVKIISSGNSALRLSQSVYVKVQDSLLYGSNYGINLDIYNISKLEIYNSSVSGNSAAVGRAYGVSNTIYLVNSQLYSVPTDGNPGITKIVNCYDNNYNIIPNQ